MIKSLTYLIFLNSFECFSWWPKYSTSVYTNDVLYVYDTYRDDNKSPGITKYALKDGLINDLKKEYFNLPDGTNNNSPLFITIPDDIRKNFPKGDKAWMLDFDNGTFGRTQDISHPNGGLRYVEDAERIVKLTVDVEDPITSNMTQSAYAVTGVREGDSYSIYVNGGIANKPGYKNTVITNGFHKYDFKTNNWTDLSRRTAYDRTSAFHKAVNVDDKIIYYLGGVYVFSDYVELPVMETNYTMYYNTFESIKRYNLAIGNWDTISTSITGSVPFNIKAGRYGFSATYSKGKIYVYGGIMSENAAKDKGALVEKESVSGYLGILDTVANQWEWHEPKEPNGEKSDRKLAFHDSIIYNNQLILTHGGIGDDNNKYKVHAIDLDTKNFSDYIGPSPKAKSIGSDNSSGLPSYAIAIIVVVIILAILIIGYLVYRNRRKSKSKNEKSPEKLQEVWAAPVTAFNANQMHDNATTGLKGMTLTSVKQNNSTLDSEALGKSRMTQFYMDLPYFQHEVDDTQDNLLQNLKKDTSNANSNIV